MNNSFKADWLVGVFLACLLVAGLSFALLWFHLWAGAWLTGGLSVVIGALALLAAKLKGFTQQQNEQR
jgi:membrane protein implicated in regulation of membrane protease activity